MIGYEVFSPPGGASEWMLTLGANDGRQVLVLPPLFEEMNFTRAFVLKFARALADRGCGVWIPDLPGTGESGRTLAEVTLEDWRAAVRAAAAHVLRASGRRPLTAAFRGGALLDDAADAPAAWRFAPATGADLLRQMRRAQMLSDKESGQSGDGPAYGAVSLIGYTVSRQLIAELQEAKPAERGRIRRVAAPAGGAPLWRRAEPGDDPALAAGLAADFHEWADSCAS